MKGLLILLIKFYWFIIPERKRRRCIFRISCSRYVYQTTKNEGFYEGLIAFRYRFLNCRSGYQIFEHPVDGHITMVLPNGQLLTEAGISEKLLQ
jgi:putative component of membrane protein insertase Oxa1/YidC/SpoIIIJ protein YidD